MKIVIIGSGWLGAPLAEQLCNAGHQIAVTYRKNKPALNREIKSYTIADFSADFTNTLLNAEAVIFAFPPPKNDAKTHAETCLEIVPFTNDNCRFIFASTTGVYPNENTIYSETTDLSPFTNKHLETERELTSKLQDRLTIIRLAGLVGENRFPVRNMAVSGKTYNGNECVNLLHLKDAVGIFSFVIEENIKLSVINACSPNHPEKGEYYSWMAKQLGIDPPVFEKGPTGKTIQSDLSISLGYRYLHPDPYDFI